MGSLLMAVPEPEPLAGHCGRSFDRVTRVLRGSREARGLSQEELAGAIGIRQPHYSSIEARGSRPSVLVLARMRAVLGLSDSEVSALLDGWLAQDSVPCSSGCAA